MWLTKNENPPISPIAQGTTLLSTLHTFGTVKNLWIHTQSTEFFRLNTVPSNPHLNYRKMSTIRSLQQPSPKGIYTTCSTPRAVSYGCSYTTDWTMPFGCIPARAIMIDWERGNCNLRWSFGCLERSRDNCSDCCVECIPTCSCFNTKHLLDIH